MTWKSGTWGVESRLRSKKRAESGYWLSYSKRTKEMAYGKLGSKCNICGFSDIRALQIDHVNGGGSNKNGNQTGNLRMKIYKEIINGEVQKYQLLCANCNWIKRWSNREGGEKY